MHPPRRNCLAFSVAALTLSVTPLHAQQPWPSRPIKGINPFAAGGPSDVLGRLIGDKLAQRLGQSFIMENRTGAAGNIGIDALAKSAADGYTIAWIVDFNLTVNPSLYPKMPYDVGRRLGQRVDADVAGRAGAVFHDEWLAQALAKLVADQAPEQVGRPAGGERVDALDRARRPGLLRPYGHSGDERERAESNAD